MKRILFILLIGVIPMSFLYGQKDMFDESIEMANQVNDLLVDAVASFMEYPYDHQNTIVVYNRLKKVAEVCDKALENKYEILRDYDNWKTRLYIEKLEHTKIVADAHEELLKVIIGYNSSGIEWEVMNVVLNPLFDEAGWQRTKLDVNCNDAEFYEYSCGNFKIMFIRNLLPANDYRNGIYHNIEVTFTYAGAYSGGGSYYVGGGKYRVIQYKDDSHTVYYKVMKAQSVRK